MVTPTRKLLWARIFLSSPLLPYFFLLPLNRPFFLLLYLLFLLFSHFLFLNPLPTGNEGQEAGEEKKKKRKAKNFFPPSKVAIGLDAASLFMSNWVFGRLWVLFSELLMCCCFHKELFSIGWSNWHCALLQ